jgi:hypothetical protein
MDASAVVRSLSSVVFYGSGLKHQIVLHGSEKKLIFGNKRSIRLNEFIDMVDDVSAIGICLWDVTLYKLL